MTLDTAYVYVQAIPESIPSRTKSFAELGQNTVFRMSHSSKLVLEKAKQYSSNIVALGHSSILREAIARGATGVVTLPLCDDPLVQAESIRDLVKDRAKSLVFLIGENLDGPFSGSALCGALSQVCNLAFELDLDEKANPRSGCVILVRDDGSRAFNIDIRKINFASSKEISESEVVGKSPLDKLQMRTPDTIKDQAPSEIAQSISRRVRRLTS